jgi:hypothetical protein
MLWGSVAFVVGLFGALIVYRRGSVADALLDVLDALSVDIVWAAIDLLFSIF